MAVATLGDGYDMAVLFSISVPLPNRLDAPTVEGMGLMSWFVASSMLERLEQVRRI